MRITAELYHNGSASSLDSKSACPSCRKGGSSHTARVSEGCPYGAGLSSAQEDEPWKSIQKFSLDWMLPRAATPWRLSKRVAKAIYNDKDPSRAGW
jgi:hypothetical protein